MQEWNLMFEEILVLFFWQLTQVQTNFNFNDI